MKIAVIGSGVSGLVCADALHRRHEVHVFESEPRPGGHARTVEVEVAGRPVSVDVGFIVYNERTYPRFMALLDRLGVETRPTEMSFSLRDESRGLEYSGSGLDGLFAQRRNLLRPSFLRMVRDILRFFREARELVAHPDPKVSLGEFLDGRGYSRTFQRDHLLPMAGAIWSAEPEQMRDFPALHFARFFENHGLLQVRDRPRWRTVVGGSQRYVEALCAPFAHRLRLACPVSAVERRSDGVVVHSEAGPERFDRVVLACHSDTALALLRDPYPLEARLLSAIRYQANDVVLHTDARRLPRSRRAWASWNAHAASGRGIGVTYHMNRLQHLELPEELCVTLNATDAIDPARILYRTRFDHPLFDRRAMEAQALRPRVSGRDRIHFCGAYWGYGFHEDGTRSGLEAADEIEGRA